MAATPTNLSSKDVLELEQDVLNILKKVDQKKYYLHNGDFRQLNNHLQYCLTTIRNISQTLAVQQADPYNSFQADYTATNGMTGKKIKYMPDGSVKIVDAAALNTTGDGWENQFDETMLVRPPCFQSPPQNLTNLTSIRQATEWNRIQSVAASRDPAGVQRL
jgi:hypothetical protein